MSSSRFRAARPALSLVGALALLVTTAPMAPLAARSLTCESDGYYRRCAADTRDGVRIERELGQAACVKDQSWGYDDAAIWVDRGCRAVFAVGPDTGSSGAQAPYPGANADPDEGGGLGTGAVLGTLGAAAAVGAIAALLANNDDDSDDKAKDRREKAAKLCLDRASGEIRDRGGRGAKLDRIVRARARKGEVELVADIIARFGRERDNQRVRVECVADMRGRNQVVAFRTDGLGWGGWRNSDWRDQGWRDDGWRSRERGDDERWNDRQRGFGDFGGWGDGGGGERRDMAVQACAREADRRGFNVVDITNTDRRRDGFMVEMEVRQGNRRGTAQCEYDADRRDARLVDVERRSR